MTWTTDVQLKMFNKVWLSSSSSSIMFGCRFTKAAHTTIELTYGFNVRGIAPRNMEKHFSFRIIHPT